MPVDNGVGHTGRPEDFSSKVSGAVAAEEGRYGYAVGTGLEERLCEVRPEHVPGPVKARVQYTSICDYFASIYVSNLTFFVLMAVLTTFAVIFSIRLNQLVNPSGYISFESEESGERESVVGYKDIVVGNTLDTKANHKCVEAPSNVVCEKNAEQLGRTGEWPDKFDIYREGSKVCARRIDNSGEWGLNLVLRCKIVATQAAKKEGAIEIKKVDYVVKIGNSLKEKTNTKCVKAPEDVYCDNKAEQVGRTGQYADAFTIYHEDDKICAHRTDQTDPWGLDLTLKCSVVKGHLVSIGKSLDKNTKCVADPGNVECDDAALQMGGDGKDPDTFNIYHKDGKICARRTDHPDPWGLNLLLRCRAK